MHAFRRTLRPAPIILGLLLAVAFAPVSPLTHAQGTTHTFPETGHTAQGAFWQYWQSHGGLAQQGYPLSEEIQERADLNGQTYTVQYYERAVFEQHPENAPPYDVLLSQVGTYRYQARYGAAGAPGQHASTSNPRVFPETGHILGGAFRTYWEQHGGLAQQGFPISDEFQETSDLNGQTYTVQYFERAVFEQHPENAPPYDVLLSQLGTFQYQGKYQGSAPPPAPTPATPTPRGSGPGSVATPTTAPVVPKGAYMASATVSNPAPTWNSHVTVTGRLLQGGQPVAGATMQTAWHYKTTLSACTGVTSADGVASCARSISHATRGYPVDIDVTFVDAQGKTLATASTSFTPR
jgi:hypothetical protein